MSARWAAVLADPADGAAAPPGIDRTLFARALAEDVLEVLAELAGVSAALACPVTYDDPAGLVWPGTPVLTATSVSQAFAALAGLGAGEALVVAPDAPDLPPLLLGKLWSALSSAAVSVVPADGGGLVALAARLPLPGWAGEPSLDAPLDVLRAAAPRRQLAVGPGWHRLRSPADLTRLDPGLQGWECTRALLQGRPLP